MSELVVEHVVLGMAGHIDHGKTAIVKALTGTNTDRLKEEIERGMTTDLGFAFLSKDITIIDVPGHEKFVKTMVAGVNTVDLAMLVIAADDGIMPQTREHLEIINLLQVSCGIIALNKIDLVEPDWVELVTEDIRDIVKGTVLENAPIVPVCAVDNTGIDFLRDEIFRISKFVNIRRNKGVFRMPVDRVFTIKGFGTVVAGTILSGNVSPEDTIELLPQRIPLRVRGVQVHDKAVDVGCIGYRTAINLGKIEKQSIERGDVLAESGYFKPTYMVDAQFKLLKSWNRDLTHRTRVRVHLGTSEVIARIVLLDSEVYTPGDEGFVQIHFEKPVVADMGDRFVIRSYSPLRTMGGGTILDANPVKHKRFKDDVIEKLERLLCGDPDQVVLEHFDRKRFMPLMLDELMKSLSITKNDLNKRIASLEEEKLIRWVGKKRLISSANYNMLSKKISNLLEVFHEQNPLQFAVPAAKLKLLVKQPVDKNVFDEILESFREKNVVGIDGDRIRLLEHKVVLTPKQAEFKAGILKKFTDNPFNPPKIEEITSQFGKSSQEIFDYLISSGELIPVEKGMYFHKLSIKMIKEKVSNLLCGEIKNASISDIRGVLEEMPRKKVVALLEFFDRSGFTIRDGDIRKIGI